MELKSVVLKCCLCHLIFPNISLKKWPNLIIMIILILYNETLKITQMIAILH